MFLNKNYLHHFLLLNIQLLQDEKEYVLVSLVLLFCPDMLDLVERRLEINKPFHPTKFSQFVVILLNFKKDPNKLVFQEGGRLPAEVCHLAPKIPQ